MSKSSNMAQEAASTKATSLHAVSQEASTSVEWGSYAACAALPVLAMGLLYKACKSNKSSTAVASMTQNDNRFTKLIS